MQGILLYRLPLLAFNQSARADKKERMGRMNKELYESEHKKLCDEMTKRYGADWVKDKHAVKQIKKTAKVCEGKKPAEVFEN